MLAPLCGNAQEWFPERHEPCKIGGRYFSACKGSVHDKLIERGGDKQNLKVDQFMKRTGLLLCFAWAWAHGVAGQPWCPSLDTRWWHTYSQISAGYGHVLTTYASDSLIDGENWQKLQVVATWQDLSSSDPPVIFESWLHLTKVEDQTVFLREGDAVDTLYRFDAVVGDRWSVPFMTSPQLTYVVTDVGVRTVEGVDLSWCAVDVVNDKGLYYLDTLLERVGFLYQFINPVYSLNLEPNIYALRCYSDNDLNYQADPSAPCEVITQVANLNTNENDLRVWYDEWSSQLNVELRALQFGNYELVESSGRVLSRGTLHGGNNQLSALGLLPGVYMLRVFDGLGGARTRKWIRP